MSSTTQHTLPDEQLKLEQQLGKLDLNTGETNVNQHARPAGQFVAQRSLHVEKTDEQKKKDIAENTPVGQKRFVLAMRSIACNTAIALILGHDVHGFSAKWNKQDSDFVEIAIMLLCDLECVKDANVADMAGIVSYLLVVPGNETKGDILYILDSMLREQKREAGEPCPPPRKDYNPGKGRNLRPAARAEAEGQIKGVIDMMIKDGLEKIIDLNNTKDFVAMEDVYDVLILLKATPMDIQRGPMGMIAYMLMNRNRYTIGQKIWVMRCIEAELSGQNEESQATELVVRPST